jgi:hypothetical protein
VFLLILGVNILLLLLGHHVVPSTLSSLEGWEELLADIAMQVVLGLLVVIGPLSFAKYPRMMALSLTLF